MKNLQYNLERIGNLFITVAYALGGIVILFPDDVNEIIVPFGKISIGILLLATALFGAPYSHIFRREE